jgi:hypothetical protein
MKWNALPALAALTLSVSLPALAQFPGTPAGQLLSDAYTGFSLRQTQFSGAAAVG